MRLVPPIKKEKRRWVHTMINYVKGDILQSKDEAVVNPVNCIGVMGAGLAKQFREKYPHMFLAYKSVCDKGHLQIGDLFVYNTDLAAPKLIINMPTKIHWKYPSKMLYIEEGLWALRCYIANHNVLSVSIPKIGTGLGGLDWVEVKQILELTLYDMTFCEVNVYE